MYFLPVVGFWVLCVVVVVWLLSFTPPKVPRNPLRRRQLAKVTNAMKQWNDLVDRTYMETSDPPEEFKTGTLGFLTAFGRALGVPQLFCAQRAKAFLTGPAGFLQLSALTAAWRTKERETRWTLLIGSIMSFLCALTGLTPEQVFTRMGMSALKSGTALLDRCRSNVLKRLKKGEDVAPLGMAFADLPTEPEPTDSDSETPPIDLHDKTPVDLGQYTNTIGGPGPETTSISLALYFVIVLTLWKGGAIPSGKGKSGTLATIVALIIGAKTVHAIVGPLIEAMFGLNISGRKQKEEYCMRYLAYGRSLSVKITKGEEVKKELVEAAESWLNSFPLAHRTAGQNADPCWAQTHQQVKAAVEHGRKVLSRGHTGPVAPWFHLYSKTPGTGKTRLMIETLPREVGKVLGIDKDYRSAYNWGGSIGSPHANVYSNQAFCYFDEFMASSDNTECSKMFDLARQNDGTSMKVSGASLETKEMECFFLAIFTASNNIIDGTSSTMSGVTAEMKEAMVSRISSIQVHWEHATSDNRRELDRSDWATKQYFTLPKPHNFIHPNTGEVCELEANQRFDHKTLVNLISASIIRERLRAEEFCTEIPGLIPIDIPFGNPRTSFTPIREQAPLPDEAPAFLLGESESIQQSPLNHPGVDSLAERITSSGLQKVEKFSKIVTEEAIEKVTTMLDFDKIMNTQSDKPIHGFLGTATDDGFIYMLAKTTGLQPYQIRPVGIIRFFWTLYWHKCPAYSTSFLLRWFVNSPSIYLFLSDPKDARGLAAEMEKIHSRVDQYSLPAGERPDITVRSSGIEVSSGAHKTASDIGRSLLLSIDMTVDWNPADLSEVVIPIVSGFPGSLYLETATCLVLYNVGVPGIQIRPLLGWWFKWNGTELIADNGDGVIKVLRAVPDDRDDRDILGRFLASPSDHASDLCTKWEISQNTRDVLALEGLEVVESQFASRISWVKILFQGMMCYTAFKALTWFFTRDETPNASQFHPSVLPGKTRGDGSITEQRRRVRQRDYRNTDFSPEEDIPAPPPDANSAIVRSVMNSLVNISVGEGSGQMMGWAISKCIVVTCDHGLEGREFCVVRHNSTNYNANVISHDPKNDIAILQVTGQLEVPDLFHLILPNRDPLERRGIVSYAVPVLDRDTHTYTWWSGSGAYYSSGIKGTAECKRPPFGPCFLFSTSEFEMRAGTSGTPYLIRARGQWMLGGMQRATGPRSAIGTLVTGDYLGAHRDEKFEPTARSRNRDQVALTDSKIFHEWDTGRPLRVIPGQEQLLSPEIDPDGFDPEGPYKQVGSTTTFFPPGSMTKITPRPCSDVAEINGFPRTTEPAWPSNKILATGKVPLDRKGNAHVPNIRLSHAIRDRDLSQTDFEDMLSAAVDLAEEDHAAMNFPQDLRAYTASEALNNGYSGATLPRFDLSASAGPTLRAATGIHTKSEAVKSDPDGFYSLDTDSPAGQLLLQQIRTARAISEEGRTWTALNILKQKDEQLPSDKAWRPRIFCARDYFAVILEKMVLGPIQTLFMKNRSNIAPQIGASWMGYASHWMRANEEFGSFAASMDFSGFDYSVSDKWLRIAEAYFVHLAELIGYSDIDIRLTRAVFRSIRNQGSIYKRDLIAVNGTMPSGMWGTSLIDSVIVYLIWTMAAAKAYRIPPAEVRESLRVSTSGDDSHAVVRRGLEKKMPLKPMVKIVENWGFRLTTAAKDGEEIDEWAPLWETQFLSLTFHRVGDVLVLPKLKASSVTKMLHWTKHNCPEEWFLENRDVLASFVATDDPDEFNRFMTYWVEFGRVTGAPVTPSSFDTIRNRVIRDCVSRMAGEAKEEEEFDVTPQDLRKFAEAKKEIVQKLKRWARATERTNTSLTGKRKTEIVTALKTGDTSAPEWKWLGDALTPSNCTSMASALLTGEDLMSIDCPACTEGKTGLEEGFLLPPEDFPALSRMPVRPHPVTDPRPVRLELLSEAAPRPVAPEGLRRLRSLPPSPPLSRREPLPRDPVTGQTLTNPSTTLQTMVPTSLVRMGDLEDPPHLLGLPSLVTRASPLSPLTPVPLEQPLTLTLGEVLSQRSRLNQEKRIPAVMMQKPTPHSAPCTLGTGFTPRSLCAQDRVLGPIVKLGRTWFPAEHSLLVHCLAVKSIGQEGSQTPWSELLHGLVTKWEWLSQNGLKIERHAARRRLNLLHVLLPNL